MAVEVVHLVIDEPRPDFLALHHNGVALEVHAFRASEGRTLAWVPEAGNRKAALVSELLQLLGPLGDDGVEDVADVVADVPRESAQAHADLIRRETRSAIMVNCFEEVGDKLANAVVNGLDGRARSAQHGVANCTDSAKGHGDILSRPIGVPR